MRLRPDASAFETLVGRHHRRVWGICYRMTHNATEAEDLAQETFLRVFRHRETYEPQRPFKAWLDRICINVCLSSRDQLRRKPALIPVEPGDLALQSASAAGGGSEDPQDQVDRKDRLQYVHRLLGGLPPHYRAALVLRVFSGFSYLEIARALSCSLGTVMSRINRARQLIRHQIEEER